MSLTVKQRRALHRYNMRRCACCGAVLTACNGFTKAGDLVDGRPRPRELCGRCVEAGWRWTASSELEKINTGVPA